MSKTVYKTAFIYRIRGNKCARQVKYNRLKAHKSYIIYINTIEYAA